MRDEKLKIEVFAICYNARPNEFNCDYRYEIEHGIYTRMYRGGQEYQISHFVARASPKGMNTAWKREACGDTPREAYEELVLKLGLEKINFQL